MTEWKVDVPNSPLTWAVAIYQFPINTIYQSIWAEVSKNILINGSSWTIETSDSGTVPFLCQIKSSDTTVRGKVLKFYIDK